MHLTACSVIYGWVEKQPSHGRYFNEGYRCHDTKRPLSVTDVMTHLRERCPDICHLFVSADPFQLLVTVAIVGVQWKLNQQNQ
jgi:hypothetical protein